MESLIVTPLLASLMLACCWVDNLGVVDCGVMGYGGDQCYENAVRDCTPAKVIDSTVPMEAQITGSSGANNCEVKLRGMSYSEWDDKLKQSLPEADYADIHSESVYYKEYFTVLEGKEATCILPKGNVNVLYGPEGMDYCSGDLMDAINEVAK